ncbi:PIN-like domain-containing protein [Flaviaesturariibacter terrae]
MNVQSFDLYKIDEEKESQLFKSAYVFFDTSSLLDFYYFSEHSRNEIFEKIFKALAGRLWITQQTEFEFLKNREKVFSKPIDTYESLKSKTKGSKDGGHLEEIEGITKMLTKALRGDMLGQLKTLKEKTSKSDKHPFLEGVDFDSFEKETKSVDQTLASYCNVVSNFRKTVEEKIESQKSLLQQTLSNDTLLSLLGHAFNSTKPSSYTEIMTIVEEGEIRFRNSIPPGYLDYDNKEGFQKFGDLISWKQLLSKCKEDKKDVVLVINDMKGDWWNLDGNDNVKTPRYELVKEVNDEAGQLFWMYNISTFIHKAGLYLQAMIEAGVIEDVKNVTQPKTRETIENEIKDELIDELSRCETFADARALLVQLSNYDTFTDQQINDLVAACYNNNQIYWIRFDTDIREMISDIIVPNRDRINPSHLPDFDSLYGYTAVQ